jgi:hypothetical protein
MQVYVLSAPRGKSSALHEEQLDPTIGGHVRSSGFVGSNRELSGQGVQMSEVCEIIERFENALVADETDLKGFYSFHVYGNDNFKSMLEEELGLVLTRDQREVDLLLVKRR